VCAVNPAKSFQNRIQHPISTLNDRARRAIAGEALTAEEGMRQMSEKFRQMGSTLRGISFKPVNTLNSNRSRIVPCRLLHAFIGFPTS
jgi:hypothetical protein